MADNVKVAGNITSAPVSHIAVEFTPIPMQPGVVVLQFADVGMRVPAIPELAPASEFR